MTHYELLIDAADLQERMASDALRIVDCRFDLKQPDKGRADYLAGHIPGAVFADLDRDLAGPVAAGTGRHPLPDPDRFARTVGGWGINADTQVVVYDQAGGALAARLWWMLRWMGHRHVALLNGGLAAWQAAGGTLETDVPTPAAGDFQGTPRETRVTTVDELEAAGVGGTGVTLVDARDRPRFAGQSEPIDTVAGHIPGAVNYPFADNLQADGRWKSADELRQSWERLLGENIARPVTAMCGSGVTACHLVLSAIIAGLPEPRVYVGSWSEWISDPARPVAGSD